MKTLMIDCLITVGFVFLVYSLISFAQAAVVPVHVIKYDFQPNTTYVLPTECGPVYVEIEVDSI